MAEDIFLSVLIPSYNEAENIEPTLREIAEYLSGRDLVAEVIVIDDGSDDDTSKKAKKIADKFTSLKLLSYSPNRGKGYAVKKGFEAATGRYAMWIDADNSTSIKELDAFLPYMNGEWDAVIGSRRLKGSDIVEREPFLRIFMGQFYIALCNIILGLGVKDVNCGFKVFDNAKVGPLAVQMRSSGWSLDAELMFLMRRKGYTIKELPVRWEHHDKTSKVKPLKAAVDSFSSLVRIRVDHIRGLYNLR
ncbi:MAG: glycosyltransferase [Candidatus Omnitrophica bacterium]|nr:glycosyltransferase [Candidatus Omnitrophota bacterium]